MTQARTKSITLVLALGVALSISAPSFSLAASDQEQGFHCLSGWDGTHSGVIRQLKEVLRNPSSFEHERTRIAPVEGTYPNQYHVLVMDYRAENGFGGMSRGVATALVDHENCQAALVSIE